MREPTTFVGMDVHKRDIAVAMFSAGAGSVVEWRVVNEPTAVKRLAKRLQRESVGPVHCVDEAGPCGYALQRQLQQEGLSCDVVVPSMIPDPAGRQDQDRPSRRPLRRGRVFGSGAQRAWSQAHRWWLGAQAFERTAERVMFEDYLLSVEQTEARKRSLELHLEDLAREPRYAQAVGWLRCFRGVDTVTAITLVAELHDFRRFRSPSQLMAYLGLVPSEYSSGPQQHRGAITRTGNRHVRRLLIEAAWHYRHKPRVGEKLAARRQGQPAAIIALADRAQLRLCRCFRRMERRGKYATKIAVAVARELVGYLWATLIPATRTSSK